MPDANGEEGLRSLRIDAEEMSADWRLLRVHALGAGNITVRGQLDDLRQHDGAAGGDDPREDALEVCGTFRVGAYGGEFSLGGPDGAQVAAGGERIRFNALGSTAVLGFEDTTVALDAGETAVVLVGHTQLAAFRERGATGGWDVNGTMPFTAEVVADGDLPCTHDLFDFEGEITHVDGVATQAEDLHYEVAGGPTKAWFVGYGAERTMSIQTPDGTIGPVDVTPDSQQHLYAYGPETMTMRIEDLDAGPNENVGLLVHALVGLPAGMPAWMEARDVCIQDAVGDGESPSHCFSSHDFA